MLLVKRFVKWFCRLLIPKFIVREIVSNATKGVNQCFSQEGEDVLLERIFGQKDDGFFVDIGAHHPTRFSNTYKFYLKGWNGINIEPNPDVIDEFNKIRDRDSNINIGIAKENTKLTYYQFNEPALNTFCKNEMVKKNGLKSYKVIDEIKVSVVPFEEIQVKYLKNIEIDFLNIDVEGLDYEVLKSIDFDLNRPSYILIEELQSDIDSIVGESKIYKFLQGKGYGFCSRTYNTSFYKIKE